MPANGMAVLPYHQHPVVVVQRHDADCTGVLHHVALRLAATGHGNDVPADSDDLPVVRRLGGPHLEDMRVRGLVGDRGLDRHAVGNLSVSGHGSSTGSGRGSSATPASTGSSASPARVSAAWTNAANSGCARVGRDRNSGCAWVPT